MLKEKISLLVDSKKEIFCDLSDRIWDHPEIGLEEFYSSEAIIFSQICRLKLFYKELI